MSEGIPRRLRVSTRLVFNNPRMILPDTTYTAHSWGSAGATGHQHRRPRQNHGQLTRVALTGGEVIDMARAKRICPKPGCPHPVNKRYCADHNREYEAKRGTSTQRGYDSKHQSLRKQWRQRIDRGGVSCASCGLPIHPQAPFDLGHTNDRTAYKGAEHVHCNRSDGGRRGRVNQQ